MASWVRVSVSASWWSQCRCRFAPGLSSTAASLSFLDLQEELEQSVQSVEAPPHRTEDLLLTSGSDPDTTAQIQVLMETRPSTSQGSSQVVTVVA